MPMRRARSTARQAAQAPGRRAVRRPIPSPRPRRLRVLITAGPTREPIDPVRFLSNASSGTMGFAIAAAVQRRGHRVTLIHGPAAIAPPARVRSIAVRSASDMLAACEAAWPAHDVLVMAAAVADYTPSHPSPVKLKKDRRGLTIRLRPTTDILARLSGRRRPGQIVVGFALEDRAGRRNAEGKLRAKGLDAIVLNRPEAIDARSSTIRVLLRDGGWQPPQTASKLRHAERLAALIEALAAGRV